MDSIQHKRSNRHMLTFSSTELSRLTSKSLGIVLSFFGMLHDSISLSASFEVRPFILDPMDWRFGHRQAPLVDGSNTLRT